MNASRFVAPSQLGPESGLGLFAGVDFESKQNVTEYTGDIIHRDSAEGRDQCYMLRIPDSGNMLIDGKVFAESLTHKTGGNRFQPERGANEFHWGAGAMANDPSNQDRLKANTKIVFILPKGHSTRELQQLAPQVAFLQVGQCGVNRGCKLGTFVNVADRNPGVVSSEQ